LRKSAIRKARKGKRAFQKRGEKPGKEQWGNKACKGGWSDNRRNESLSEILLQKGGKNKKWKGEITEGVGRGVKGQKEAVDSREAGISQGRHETYRLKKKQHNRKKREGLKKRK